MGNRAWRAGLLAIVLLGVGVAKAGAEDDHKPSFPIEAEARAFVDKHPREELAKDDVFVAVLKDLAKSDLSVPAKADAFALMQERIGWLFNGTMRLFPGNGYFQSQVQVLSTYFRYQEKMPEGLDVAPLLAFAKGSRRDHPLRGPNALLLATILNRKASHDAVMAAIDLEAINASPVPAIDLHYLAMAAALTADPKVVAKALALLPEVGSKEGREDLLAAAGIFRVDELSDAVEGFLRGWFPAHDDRSVWTGLMVLAHAGPEARFRAFYKSLGKDEASIDKLRKFWDNGFRDTLQSDDPARPALKVWDGFKVQVEAEGAWVKFGDAYRCWISFK